MDACGGWVITLGESGRERRKGSGRREGVYRSGEDCVDQCEEPFVSEVADKTNGCFELYRVALQPHVFLYVSRGE